MDSFNFDSLDSTTRDQTLAFLNNYNPTPLPDSAPAELETVDWSMSDWSLTENPTWDLHSNADLAGGMSNTLTDNSFPGSFLPGPGWGIENMSPHPDQVMGAAESFEDGKLR
jgi:hypothetical protein